MKLKRAFLFSTALIIAGQIIAQDLIYKKNGGKIEALVINKSRQSRSYKLLNQPDSTIFYINTTILDSIVYQNGEKEDFHTTGANKLLPVQKTEFRYRHHLIGVDYLSALNDIFAVSYEYMPGKCKVGLKATVAFNLDESYLEKWDNYEESYSYRNFNSDLNWHVLSGINYYFFPQRTFRFSTGLHYLFGGYTIRNYFYNNTSGVSDFTESHSRLNGSVLSIFTFYNINKSIAINLGAFIPLAMNPSFRSAVFSSEILFNF